MRPRAFLDFDQCLYDTEAAIAYFLDDAAKIVGRERVQEVLESLNATGFSPEAYVQALGFGPEKVDEYKQSVLSAGRLYDGAFEALEKLSKTHDLILVTYGNPTYQDLKIESVREIRALLADCNVVWKGPTKGDVIAEYGEREGDIFVDDVPKHLLDVQAKAPWVQVIRIMNASSATASPHEDDGVRWPVARSFEELNALLAGGTDGVHRS